jgi:hypothetical protein
MGALRILKRVSKFPANIGTYHDPYSFDAFQHVTGPAGKSMLDTVSRDWHRPSGDVQLLEDGIMKYDTLSRPRCIDGDYLAVLKKTLDELRPPQRIIPLTLGAAAKHPRFPRTTSPGFPWTHQGFATKADVLNDTGASAKIHRAWDTIGRGAPWSLPDSLAFHRVVASERTRTKVRPVWGYPTDVVLEEARFFLPLMGPLTDHCNVTDSCYGMGLETARSGHRHIAQHFKSDAINYVLNGDYSNFDAHVPAWLIRDIFSHLSDWFDFTKVIDSEGKIWNVNPEQTCRRWKAMVSYFVKTKVRTPSGLRVQKSHGVPSGSMFTNIIDTIANAVQTRTGFWRVYGRLPEKDYYYGDDSCILLRELLDLEALARVLDETFGAILSVDKTTISSNPDNIHWLGYYYRDGGPSRDLRFIVASTIFPEREVTSPLEACARLLGQLYSCMDPIGSVVFYDAIQYLLKKWSIPADLLNQYIAQLPSKAMKFLITVGLELSEITLPSVETTAFGGRYIYDVLPKPSQRIPCGLRSPSLPDWAFAAEAYANRHLRTPRSFQDFSLYKTTFERLHGDFEEDEEYFSS